jgi:hypothetical protein
MFVCFEVWFPFLPIGQLFHFRVFLHVRGPTERLFIVLPCLLRSFIILLASYGFEYI